MAVAKAKNVTPPSGDVVHKEQARAAAASFTRRVVGGDGHRNLFSAMERSGGGAARGKKAVAVVAAAGATGESKRVSAIEGLTFGSVRAKAIAWSKSRNR